MPTDKPGSRLRDPEGFSGSVVIPYAAASLASLMDGDRTLAEIQDEFQRKFSQSVALEDLEDLVRQLDERHFLDNDRFRARWKREVELYLTNPVRPAAHAGGAYAGEPQALRQQLDSLFLPPAGPGIPAEPGSRIGRSRLAGVLSPHIDLHRGGPAFAWTYKRVVEETDADLFVIFGTAHSWTPQLFSVTRKHFDTPLGTVETDRFFIQRLAAKLKAEPGGADLDLFASELAHRQEHSIEFQVLFLQYLSLLGGMRPLKVVPILTGSFHPFVAAGQQPITSPVVRAFVDALRATVAEHPGRVCYISGGDLAHIGQRFGDRQVLDEPRLRAQAEFDRDCSTRPAEPMRPTFSIAWRRSKIATGFAAYRRPIRCSKSCGPSAANYSNTIRPSSPTALRASASAAWRFTTGAINKK